MLKITRTLSAVSLTGILVFLATGPAFAEDCFNASRSGQGNTAAAKAGTWWSVPEFLAVVAGLTPDQITKAMPVIEADSRIPDGFTVFYNAHHPGELASPAPSKVVTNGKGIDHSDDYSTPVFQAIFEDVAVALS